MKTIQIKNAISTGLDSSLDKPIGKISLKDNLLGFGGFGEVYEVTGLDGNPSKLPLVAKVLYSGKERNYQNVVALQKLVLDEIATLKNAKQKFFEEYPSLIALPLLSFEGTLDGKTIKGYLSLDLNRLGFINAESFFKVNTDLWIQLQNRPWYFKYKIAYVLAMGCSFLRKIHFIHADITPDNLFIHTTAPLCALIDFDSGAIIASNKDAPTTEGKHYSEWEAPELTSDDPKINKLTAFADDWALAITLHKILTGWQAFFTKHCSYKALEKWNKMYDENPELQWPEISTKQAYADLFNKEGLACFDRYMECYAPIDAALKVGFQVTFVKGATNYLKRWDSNKWVTALEKSLETCKSNTPKPAIDYFEKREQSVSEQFPDEQTTTKASPPLKPDKLDKPDKFDKPDKIKPVYSLKDYVNELIPDLVNGTQKLFIHKPFILKMANEIGKDGNKYLEELTDFLDLFKECIKDKKVTRFEYYNLLLQARMVKIDRDILDKLLEPYEILQ